MSNEKKQLRPLFLIKPNTVSKEDIKRAEKGCNIVMIECSEPQEARFLDPPITEPIDAQARAAMSLVRMLVNRTDTGYLDGNSLVKWFANKLLYEPQPNKVIPVKR